MAWYGMVLAWFTLVFIGSRHVKASNAAGVELVL